MQTSNSQYQIISHTERLFRNNFGHSPEGISVSVDDRCMTIHLHRFIGRDLEELVSQHDNDALRSTRELIMEYIVPDLLKSIERDTGMYFDSVFYDWDDHDLSGLITGLINRNRYQAKEDYYPGKDDVHRQVSKLTYDVQKVPNAIYSFWVNPDIFVIVREGLLIKIEMAFLQLGFVDTLRKTKRALEKSLFIKDSKIPEILGRKLKSMYLDWKFEQDKSALVYIFE